MEEQEVLTELLDLAEVLGLEIRRAALGGQGGGRCRVGVKEILFVDTDASSSERIARTAGALAEMGNLEDRFVLPQIREVIERYRNDVL